MTNKLDLYKEYFDAAWADPPASLTEANETYLSDDFQSLDKDGNVQQDRDAFGAMGQLMYTAFEDFKFVVSDLREESDGVIVDGHFEGTHTSDLDLSALGLGVIPASGKRIVWPNSSSNFKIAGGKIVSVHDYGDTDGVRDFLTALGVTMPSA
jgi:predicted ester cyclase